MLRVSAMYIIKNEEEYLPFSLKSIINVVDEIIIVDNGSTDRSLAIAASFPKTKIYHSRSEDFSELRNIALEKATGDWLMRVDGDEVFYEDINYKLPILLRNQAKSGIDGYYGWFYHLVREYGLMANKADKDPLYLKRFLFKRKPGLRWVNKVHEELQGVQNYADSDIFFVHYGYCKPQRFTWAKWKRYNEMVNGPYTVDHIDPDHCLDDWVLQPFTKPHPLVIRDYIESKLRQQSK